MRPDTPARAELLRAAEDLKGRMLEHGIHAQELDGEDEILIRFDFGLGGTCRLAETKLPPGKTEHRYHITCDTEYPITRPLSDDRMELLAPPGQWQVIAGKMLMDLEKLKSCLGPREYEAQKEELKKMKGTPWNQAGTPVPNGGAT